MMLDTVLTLDVAVVQAASTLFDREATLVKACTLAREAAVRGAQLALFPEAFVPAYPRGLSFSVIIRQRKPEDWRLWERHWANTVNGPGPAKESLVNACGRGALRSGANTKRAHGYVKRARNVLINVSPVTV